MFADVSVAGPLPLIYHLKDIQTREDLCTREVNVFQNGTLTIKSQISFHEVCRESIAHQCHMPVTPMPEFCTPVSDAIKQLLENSDEETLSISPEIHEFASTILSNPINELFDTYLCISQCENAE
ncbi:unnamed protein product [Gongylonema pulchrum]|uniref:Uncharacterized protein n=1 Tax=Gongylonema pulchrum TaxID=637853 RepID=A0A183EXE3_9BILA|nr:unnamed protein product [Gongylonema pulchrum]